VTFNGFTKKDFEAFSNKKTRYKKFNSERKIVWQKMRVLQEELNNQLPSGIYVKPYSVSPYWISNRKKEVDMVWIPYGPPDVEKKYGYTYQRYPHLSLGIDRDGLVFSFLITDVAEKYGGKYQSKFLTFMWMEYEKLRDILYESLTQLRLDTMVVDLLYPDLERELRRKTFDKDFKEVYQDVDLSLLGKQYIKIWVSLNSKDIYDKNRIIESAAIFLRIFAPLVKYVVKCKPYDKEFLHLLFRGQKDKNRKVEKSTSASRQNKEKKYVEAVIPHLHNLGLDCVKREHEFPTEDRADLVCYDRKTNRIAVVEVELNVEKKDKKGFLQALKYRSLMAGELEKPLRHVRALLIAKSIHKDIKKLCKKYNIDYMEISA